jgi:small subunit ribosomal protein S6
MTENKQTNLYELVLIISQYAEIDSVLNGVQDDLAQKASNSGSSNSFSLIKKEFWGKRNLAYKINKIKKADYHVVYFESDAEALKIIERKLRMNQDVIRFLFLKIKEIPISNPPIMASLLTSENVEAINKKLSNQKENDQDNSSHLMSDEESQEFALNWISYKNPDLLLRYISDIYMISSRKFNGLTALQQRTLKTEIARARFLAILPFTVIKRK